MEWTRPFVYLRVSDPVQLLPLSLVLPRSMWTSADVNNSQTSKMIVLSAALFSSPLSWKTQGPNSSFIALHAFLPGSTILLAMASASMTGTPSSRNMLDTVLFPVATPPVSPTKYMLNCVKFDHFC